MCNPLTRKSGFKKNYLLLVLLGLHCCAGFSWVLASGGYSLVAVPWFPLWITGSRVLRHQWLPHVGSVVGTPGLLNTGLVVVVHKFSCSSACGIFWIGVESMSPAKSCPTLRDLIDVAHQTPLSMGFPRQGYRSGLPFPFPGDLPDPEIEPMSPAWQAGSLPLSHQGSPRKSNF